MVSCIRSVLVFTTLTFVGAAAAMAQDAKPTPASALERLKDGNNRFVADTPSKRNVGKDRRAELAKGQHPFAIVLTCADSRVSPELVFDTGLGDLFVLRVAGNIAEPAVVGSIEYAVEHLHVPLIIVLGHESCGAVTAAIDGTPLHGDLGWLISKIKAGDKLPEGKDAKLAAGIRNNARAAAADLELRSTIIHEEVQHKKVMIVSGVYSLKTGKIEWMMPSEKKKTSAVEKIHPPVATTPAMLPAGISPTLAVEVYSQQPARLPRLQAFFQRTR